MTPQDQARKMAHIAALASLEECKGWRMGVETARRDWFPGELAALIRRESELRGAKK